MKRRLSLLVCVVLLALVTLCAFVACDDKQEENAETPQTSLTFTIQYTDDYGTYTINVGHGMPYSLESIPQRIGYDFIGLYDSEVGGTQYVNAAGASISPYYDLKNIVLFPQYKAKQYTIILDFDGTEVIGSREKTVEYDSAIGELPMGLIKQNYNFKGWYTEKNCKGTQIADEYGVLPQRKIVNATNYDLSDGSNFIYLYAGFEGVPQHLTLYVNTDTYEYIEMDVPYGTHIKDVVPDYRDSRGYGVYSWTASPEADATAPLFNDEITTDLTLYAVEFAPVIELDSNCDEGTIMLVQRAGMELMLPVLDRKTFEFVGWYFEDGREFTSIVMPNSSIKLIAKWNAVLTFNSNGGNSVENLSAEPGSKIILPEPVREGFKFAGWYKSDGTIFDDQVMPASGLELKAGYYAMTSITRVFLDAATTLILNNDNPQLNIGYDSATIDLTELRRNGVDEITITANYKCADVNSNNVIDPVRESSPAYTYTAYYSQESTSDAYLIWEYSDKHTMGGYWKTCQHKSTIPLNSDIIYVCFYGKYSKGNSLAQSYRWTDYYLIIEYPDTSILY